MRKMLPLADREEISRGLAEGLQYKEIARLVERDPSGVSRDVARHCGRVEYRAVTVDAGAVAGRQRPKVYAVDRSPQAVTEIGAISFLGYSPESVFRMALREAS